MEIQIHSSIEKSRKRLITTSNDQCRKIPFKGHLRSGKPQTGTQSILISELENVTPTIN
jgi:hypothetical protein